MKELLVVQIEPGPRCHILEHDGEDKSQQTRQFERVHLILRLGKATNSSETRVNHVGKEGQKDPDSHGNDGCDRQRAIEIHHGKEESEDIVSTRSKGRKRNPLHRTQDVFLLLIVDPTDADPLQNVNNHQTERNVQIAHDLRGDCSLHYKYRNEAHRR